MLFLLYIYVENEWNIESRTGSRPGDNGCTALDHFYFS